MQQQQVFSLYRQILRAVHRLPEKPIQKKLRYNVREGFLAFAAVSATEAEKAMEHGHRTLQALQYLGSQPPELLARLLPPRDLSAHDNNNEHP